MQKLILILILLAVTFETYSQKVNKFTSKVIIDTNFLDTLTFTKNWSYPWYTFKDESGKFITGFARELEAEYNPAVCFVRTFSGVIAHLDLSPANVHDVNYLYDIEQQVSACLLIGDKGYLDKERTLGKTSNLTLHQ